MKASNNWSDKGFNELVQFLRDLLPKDNVLPQITYHAKKIGCPLGLKVEKIHVCRNDYMLFHNDDAMLEECHICGSSRYKGNVTNFDGDDMEENKNDKRLTTKVA
jgi:hypothetical protein